MHSPGLQKRTTSWSHPTDWDTVCRRASGRRSYNAIRQIQALVRRRRLVDLLVSQRAMLTAHGVQAKLARTLGVHRSTICRDIAALLAEAASSRRCPCCGHHIALPLNFPTP